MPDLEATTSRRSRSDLHGGWLWRATAAGLVALFVVRLAYFLFHDAADGTTGHVAHRVFEEVTGGVLAILPVCGLVWLAQRVPLARHAWRRAVMVYTAAFVAVSLLHTWAMVVVRATLAPWLGLKGYAFTVGLARYAYEAANDVLPIVALLALLALAESVVAQRDRERRAAELERSLLRAELSNLRLQLQPHFLFNALNTISSTMYEDVHAADAQLGQLADLLRVSLRTTHAHEVPVRDELQLLSQYLELIRARFGERLMVTVDAPDEVGDLLVPSMVLQPLVENAVRHGGVGRVGHGRISIMLQRIDGPTGNTLALRVHDDGPPVEMRVGKATDGGTGLSATARRLRLLYPDAHAMRAGSAGGDGGFEVALRIPARTRALAEDALADAGTPGARR